LIDKLIKIIPAHQNNIYPTDGDTSYGNYVAAGTQKYIPKYHDENTSLILTETLSTRQYNGFVVIEDRLPKNWSTKKDFDAHKYMDSLYIQDLFDGLVNSELYSGIFISNRKFYVDFKFSIDEDLHGMKYTLKLYEVVDASALNLPADYGCTIWPEENIEELKPLMVDPKTKKLLYPELSEKQNMKKGKR